MDNTVVVKAECSFFHFAQLECSILICLPQILVFRLGLLQDGDFGFIVFPDWGTSPICAKSLWNLGAERYLLNMGSTFRANIQLLRSS